MREIIKLVVVLTLICGISVGTLEIARANLAGRIEKQNDRYIRGPALSRLFAKPADELLENKINLNLDGQKYPVFFMRENGKVTGLAVEATGKGGYGGDIQIMLGIDLLTGKLKGMEIIQHSETPGVGAQVEKENFRSQWINLPLTENIALRQDNGKIQGITGATYSSRAVVDGTNRILNLVTQHRDEIINEIQAKAK